MPEWIDQDDPRHGITWHHLLHMASGLSWIEEYTTDRGSDVINMLFGDGKSDVAAFAAAFPLSSRPGTQFLYSSGTSNILARALQKHLGLAGDEAGMRAWLSAELFDPIGMTSADPQFDESGTWVASSYVDATARDFARFGLLALRGGTWDGRTIVERSWVDTARTPIKLPTNHADRYGSHWWVHDDGLGTFSAHGYEGQRVTCVPARDLVLVRLGKTPPTPQDRDPRPAPGRRLPRQDHRLLRGLHLRLSPNPDRTPGRTTGSNTKGNPCASEAFAGDLGGPNSTVQAAVDAARVAADAGFTSFWMPQIFALDALTTLGVIGQVPAIELGTAVVPATRVTRGTRTAGADRAVRLGGRLTLGIGLSHQVVIEHMMGYSFDKPASTWRSTSRRWLPCSAERPTSTATGDNPHEARHRRPPLPD